MSSLRDEDDHGARNGLATALLEKAMERGVPTSIKVAGSSMLPLIRSGDTLRVRPFAEGHLEPGDVVALRDPRGGSLFVHRVIARDAEGLIVQGDNVAHQDGRFGQESVMGVVTRVERNGRSVWFGSGRWGGLVARAVRGGLVWRFNRAYYGTRRRVRACLKFLPGPSRLREHKGDDGKE